MEERVPSVGVLGHFVKALLGSVIINNAIKKDKN